MTDYFIRKSHIKKESFREMEMVFCYQNSSDLLWERNSSDQEKPLKFEAKGQKFAKK